MLAIVAPMSIPRGHADDQSESIVSSGYVIKGYVDPYLGSNTVFDAIQAGSTLRIVVPFHADTQPIVRNMSLGIKFDWMTSFQNSTMASPQNPYQVFANQWVYLSINYTIPNLTGAYSGLNLSPHSWKVQVWDYQSGSMYGSNLGCGVGYTYDNEVWTGTYYKTINSCHEFDDYSVAIYSSQQSSAVLAKQQANTEISVLGNAFAFVSNLPPGSSSALAQLAAAKVQIGLGDTAYANGDFPTAQTDYQNALNDANAAQSSLATTGGGTDTATLTSIWVDAVAILFGGIGALLIGFAGFKYLRGRTKSLSTYTPPIAPRT